MTTKRRHHVRLRRKMAAIVGRILGPAPVHVYDYGKQFEWVKRARQWAYEQQLPEFVYPVHGWSLGIGGPKSPLTWFRCPKGHLEIGSPYRAPDHECIQCGLDWMREAMGTPMPYEPPVIAWEVADRASADSAAFEAFDRKSDYMDRYQTKS